MISFPLLMAMSFVTFGFIRLPEGDPLAPYRNNPQVPPEEVRKLERTYHFDSAFYVQYYHWVKNMFFEWSQPSTVETAIEKMVRPHVPWWQRAALRLDPGVPTKTQFNLGYSFSNRLPVTNVIGGRLLNTLILSVISLVLVWTVAIPIGTYSAVHQYSLGDKIFSFISFIGMSVPSFFLALVLLYIAAITDILPIGGLTAPDHDRMSAIGKLLDYARHMAIPAAVIVTGSLAGMQRLMRGNMLEVLRQQYITTARAKGLPENRVIYRHALRNALNPMITIFGYQFSGLLSGVALTEMITSYPGLGSIMLEAVRSQDVYLVMASAMIGGLLLIVGNLLADVLLSVADPRISYD